ncbi:hypothetical protein [Aporhodopirellula aestuarii]|uniref:Uncharacterized protein n=1 Tax=Aporhodopirellula aestuarii TaxID=2950107 RepID=A0ABT0TYY2_9BACT|nr:hypothetical protein [Aporhodopirellula aestuarii]MCM2369786.1 hypothetical protein [Aporhodopirellula aestuarii]
MKKRSFQNCSYSKSTRSARSRVTRSSRLRRMLLAALIGGSALVSANTQLSAAGIPVDQRGGISILVHEFNPSDATEENELKTDIVVDDGHNNDQIVAAATEPAAEEAVSDAPEVKDEIAPAIVSVGTHDSVPDVIASEPPQNIAAHRTSNEFNEFLAAAVSASAAKVGISVEQFLEPFAMVGPLAMKPLATTPLDTTPAPQAELTTENAVELAAKPTAEQPVEPGAAETSPTEQQLAEAVALNRWWLDEEPQADDSAVPLAKAEIAEEVDSEEVADVDATTVEAATVEIASVEPVDVSNDIAEDATVDAGTLVGSAPLIATIPEAYAPYDLAERDLKLEYMPLTTVVPISPKNYVSLPAQDELALEDEVSVAVEASPETIASVETEAETVEIADATTSEPAISASPECILDEWAHTAADWAEQVRVTDITFATLGESFGDWFANLTPAAAEPAMPTMLVDNETIPAPIPDDLPDAMPIDQVVTSEEISVESVEVAATEVPMMDVDGEMIPAPVADAAPNAASAEQIVSSEEEAPESADVAMEEIVAAEITVEEAAVEELAATQNDSMELAAAEIASSDANVEEVAVAEVAVEETAVEEVAAAEDNTVEIAAAEIASSDAKVEEVAVAEVAVEEAAAKEVAATEDSSIEIAAAEIASSDANLEEVAVVEVAVEEAAVEEVAATEDNTVEIAAAEIASSDPNVEEVAVAEVAVEVAAAEEVAATEVSSIEIAAAVIASSDANVEEVAVAEVVVEEAAVEEVAAAEDKTTEIATAEIATSEIIIAEIVTMEIDGEVIPAPIADEATDAAPQEQVVAIESEQSATESLAAAEISVPDYSDKMSISSLIAAINKWQRLTIAEILAADDTESAPIDGPAAEIAEASDSTDETLIR